MKTLDQINDENLTGKIAPVHPEDVFFSMGLGRDPSAMNLSPTKEGPSFGEAFEGSFNQKFLTTIKGAISYASKNSFNDPNYIWTESPLLKARGKDFTLAYQDGLSSISSDAEMAEALKGIDDNQKINDAINQHPVGGFIGGMLGAAPEAIAMILPGASATSLLMRTASLGASGALYGAASTLGEQQLNRSITNEDVFDNSVMGAALSVGLPLFFHGLGSKQMKGVIDFMGGKIKKPNLGSEAGMIDMSELPEVASQTPNSYNQSVGAATTKLDEFGELDVVPEGFAGKVFTAAKRAISVVATSQDIALSDSAAARQWGNETFLSNTTKNKNTEGVRSQNSIFMDQESAVSNQQYRWNEGLIAAMKAENFKGEDSNEFLKKALDDMWDNKNTPGASFVRKFNNEYAVKSNEKQIMGEGVILDEHGNYFPASLSRDKIASDVKGFTDMTKGKIERDRQEASGKLTSLIESTIRAEKEAAEEVQPKEAGKRIKAKDAKPPFNAYDVAASLENASDADKIAFLKKSKYLNPEEVKTIPQLEESLLSKQTTDEIANDVMNKFLNPSSIRQFAKDGSGGEFKAKTINYTYQEVKKYMPENLVAAQAKYIRDMELKFLVKDRYGVDTSEYVKTVVEKIAADYEPLIRNAKDPKEVSRLTNRAAHEKQIVRDTFDILAKKYDIPHTAAGVVMRNVAKFASMWQATRYLGLAALANLPDLSNLAGLKDALWLGKEIGEGLENIGRVQLSKEEAEFMHITMSEMAPTNAAMELIGQDVNGALTENMGNLDKAVNFLDKGQRKFFKYSGFNWFVNTERQLAGSFIADKILKAAQALEAGVLKKGTKEFNDLHKFGIDKNNVKAIMDEVRAHGVTKEGTLGNKYLYPNVHEWTPSVGVDFTSKLLREVEHSVTSKSVGDAPFWTNKSWGKMFTQFKGWQFGALNRQILPMIQGWGMGKEYKAVVLSRIIANMCWANITSYAYNIASGKPEKNVIDPQHILYNGFNRGNLFPFIADLSNMADAHGAGMGSALGVTNNSRYYNTDFWGRLSPGLALPADIIKTGHSLKKILDGNATADDYHQGIRMVPGTNAPIIGWAVNQLKNNQFGGS